MFYKVEATMESLVKLLQDLNHAANKLQCSMAEIDGDYGGPLPDGLMQLMVLRSKSITIRIDACRNHARPHVHVDYGRNYHVSSYAIDDGTLLVRRKEREFNKVICKFDKAIKEWIEENRDLLTEAWGKLRSGQPHEDIVVTLKGSKFG